MDQLQKDYPWTKTPLIIGAPMRLISLASLAVEVSRAGGIGFIGIGSTLTLLPEVLTTAQHLLTTSPLATRTRALPLGIGILAFSASLPTFLHTLSTHSAPYPAALWLFAPLGNDFTTLTPWATQTRQLTQHATKIWVQVGSVADAVAAVRAVRPDVLVVQGADAGGHGLQHGAGVVALLPEVADAVARLCAELAGTMPAVVAAGGVVDGRGVAACVALGAAGTVLGTRLLATPEANVGEGYRAAVVRAWDGGRVTRRTGLYDVLRGTGGWPEEYGGRGVVNRSWWDGEAGLGLEDNKRLYKEMEERELDGREDGWAEGTGRLTTYAGTGVGLVREVRGAKQVVEEVRREAECVLKRIGGARL